MDLAGADMAEAEGKGLSKGYTTALGIYWKNLLLHFGEDATLGDLNYESVRGYEKARRAKGIRGQSIREEVACLKRGFLIAERRGLVTMVPGKSFWPVIRSDPPHPGRRGKLVAVSDLRAVLAALPEEIRDELVFVSLTGLRRLELPEVRSTWLARNESGYFLNVPGSASKTGEPRTVPCSSEALAVFKRRVHRYGTGALFPLRNYRWKIRAACRQAGVPYFTYRDLRTTFATIAAANADLASVRDAMGHTGVVTTNIYLRGQDEGRAKAGRAVQRVLLGKGEEE